MGGIKAPNILGWDSLTGRLVQSLCGGPMGPIHIPPCRGGSFVEPDTRTSVETAGNQDRAGSTTRSSITGRRPQEIVASLNTESSAESAFVIGGVNSSETIRGLASLNGISIAELERRMQPGGYAKRGFCAFFSEIGFLGFGESLVKVLVEDNDFVLGQGSSHQEVAEWLKVFTDLPYQNSLADVSGITYEVETVTFRGAQYSPFEDGTSANKDITVTNPVTGRSIRYSALLPEMVARYGFYEGHGTPYRLAPADIFEMFPAILD